MKRSLSLIALAALACGTASAQSSVTLYGRVNTTLEHQKVGDTTSNSMDSNSSRWGLKGSEDMGGGLKASFLLESGFNSDTGAGGGGFTRESWVGLESAAAGKLRFGNVSTTALYSATADYISMHNHDTGSSADALYFYQGTSTDTVAYTSPTFGGVVVDAQLGLNDVGPGGVRTYVLVANYDAGPLHLGGGYVNGTDNSGFGGKKGKQFGARVLYELGAATLGAYWTNDKIEEVPFAGTVKRNAFRFSAMYAMGSSEFHANVGIAGKLKGDAGTLDDSGAKQFTLGYNYNLSKRTKVYAFYTKVDNNDNSGYYTQVLGADFSSLAVGIRHNF